MGGVDTIGVLDANGATADGASISGTDLYMQSASATAPGLVNITTQTMAGAKTFSTSLQSPIFKSSTANVASTGVLRLANNSDSIGFRNAANSSDKVMKLNASDNFSFSASLDMGGNFLQQVGTLQYLGATSGTIAISPPATVTNYTLVMPSAQGAASTLMQNDGSGNLTWVPIGAAFTTSVTTLTNWTGASTAWGDLTSTAAPLALGTYLITGTLDWVFNGATVSAAAGTVYMALSVNSGTTTTDQVIGVNQITLLAPTVTSDRSASLVYVLTVSGSPKTVYLKGIATYSIATPQYRCTLSAVRIA